MKFFVKTLCHTLSGVEVPVLTITEDININKPLIIMSGRIHPGESNGSWVM